jgi:hypothetical protein
MSQSQRSEDPSSSIYDSDFENLAYFIPDNAQLDTQDLSTSQQSLDSFDSEFIRPPPPLTVPSSLTLVGPGRKKPFVRYDREMHTEWVNWWLETGYGKSTKIRWDSNHQTDTWQQFHQVANASNGAPKVMCKRCGQILEHPYTLRLGSTARHGTSTMLRHIKSASCLRSSQKDPQKTALIKFIQSNVSYLLS